MKQAIVVLLMMWGLTLLAQNQKGSDLYGETMNDACCYGIALSQDGNTIAIGAHLNDEGGTDAGNARVFRFESNAWTQLGQTIVGGIPDVGFGVSVDLSADGTRLAVGVFGAISPFTGYARIYDWDGQSWVQAGAELLGENVDDRFGWSISLSDDGNVVAIGAFSSDSNKEDAGQVRVFKWDGAEWIQQGNNIDGLNDGDRFGWSIGLSTDGRTIAIGAPFEDNLGIDRGSVSVFDWNGTSWVSRGEKISGLADDDLLGHSLEISSDGNIIAVGLPGNDSNGEDSGQVQVFIWNGVEWIARGKFINGIAAGDFAGNLRLGLSSDGNTLVIGAATNDTNGEDSGHARVYSWDDSNWMQIGNDIVGDKAEDFTGASVSISPDGKTVAIGEPGNDSNGENAGRVRVFDLLPNGINPSRNKGSTKIFPNPFENTICFKYDDWMKELSIISPFGLEVFHSEVDKKIENIHCVKVNELSAGLYFLKISGNARSIVKPILKK